MKIFQNKLPANDCVIPWRNVFLDGIHKWPCIIVVFHVLQDFVHTDLQDFLRFGEAKSGGGHYYGSGFGCGQLVDDDLIFSDRFRVFVAAGRMKANVRSF